MKSVRFPNSSSLFTYFSVELKINLEELLNVFFVNQENTKQIAFAKFSALKVDIKYQVTQVFSSSLLLLLRESTTIESR